MLGSNGTVQIIRDIPVQNLSDTDSSECEFVLERKPPHLRTPEMVSLNSESDSDVVFVNEEKTTPPKREIPPPGVFEQTKNSSDTSDSDDNKNLTVLRMKWCKAGLREIKPGTSNEPIPSTSTGGFTGSLLAIRQPIRLKLRKRVIKSIYESTSESESDNKDNKTPDNTLIPTVQYSTSSSEDEEPIDVVGDATQQQLPLKRKYPINHEDPKNDAAQPRKRRRMNKPRKQPTTKTEKSGPKQKKLKSVIVKHSSKGNGFYVAKEKKSGTESNSSSSSSNNNNGSSADESSDDESNSVSDKNGSAGDTPGWSSTASE